MGNHLCVYVKNKRKPTITNPNPSYPSHLETILETYTPQNTIKDCNSFYTCQICCEIRPTDDTFTPHGCNHSYCTKCTVKYIVSRLQNNVLDLNCPEEGCYGQLSSQFCMQILPHEVFMWWERALCESMVPEKDKFYCPFNDCSAMLLYSEPQQGEDAISDCPHCKRSVCVKCKAPWHSEITCDKFQKLKNNNDALMIDLAKRRNWIRCPNCKLYVEKKKGCNYIICRCSQRFCYKCGGEMGRYFVHCCHLKN